MVDRDDLLDGGAAHVGANRRRRCVSAAPSLLVETLVGDFGGASATSTRMVESAPDVFAHNVEVVRRLTPKIRDQRCDYDLSLDVLRTPKSAPAGALREELDHGRHRRDRRRSASRPWQICAAPASTSSRSANTCGRRRSTRRSSATSTPDDFARLRARGGREWASLSSPPARSCARAITRPRASWRRARGPGDHADQRQPANRGCFALPNAAGDAPGRRVDPARVVGPKVT